MQPMDTRLKHLDVLPMVKHYITELGVHKLFETYIPNNNGSEIDPAQVLCVMIMNIVAAAKPLYQVDEWLSDYLDGKTEEMSLAGKYNDDRLGRCLDRLFNADRHSLMTAATCAAIKVYELETGRIHNDSTTVSFSGAYERFADGTVDLARGYNKDGRPDCKQIVFGLNITEDGHVPLSYQLFDGNQADVTTHIPNWDRLRELLGREDFIYIGDSKVCSTANMNHIVGNGGKFITILPKNRKEVVQFRDRLEQGEEIEWQDGYRKEDSRKKGSWVTYRFYEGEKSQEGYRIIWVHSSSKEIQDRKTRDRRISKTEEGFKELSGKLNRYKLKTREQIEQVVASICKGSGDLVMPEIIEEKTVAKVKIGRGRPGPNTDYEDREQINYRLQWCRNEEAIKKDARTDGIFPLITNTELAATEVLQTYKKQPFLEKRFQTQKTVLEVAPVFLEKPSRIEAMMFLYFIGLMIVSLMERNIRKEMATQKITKIPISASGLKTKSPTWNNLCRFFRNVHLSLITQGQMIIRSSVKGLTALHYQMLKLLKVSRTAYDLTDGWWQFMPG